MKTMGKPLSCAEVNKQDMVDYLFGLGFEAKRISGHHYWFLSPFRSERTASFKVNRTLNRWYDFGEGKGGTLVDFGILYFKCTVSDFLYRFAIPSLFPQCHHEKEEQGQPDEEQSVQIKKVQNLHSSCLLSYLKSRKIDLRFAQQFCKEIQFEIRGKSILTIGFKNDTGGYELRNSFFKGSTAPKDITTIDNKSKKVTVFEGFFDFLSYQTICKNSEQILCDFIILNSLSFLQKLEPYLVNYTDVNLFLDRDKSGQKATSHLLSFANHIRDRSELYRNHKDVNAWLMNFGLCSKCTQTLKISGSPQRP